MKSQFSLAVVLISILTGCQSALRQYDGVLGYKVTSNVQGRISILYIDEDRRSWEEVIKRARLACKHELKTNSGTVSINILKQEQFSKQIEMRMSVPIAITTIGASTGDSSGNNAGGGFVSSTNMNEMLMRNIKLKSMSVECIAS